MADPLFRKDTVENEVSSERQQACFRALAFKHRELAARTRDKGLADGHLVLADGYERLIRAIADFDLSRERPVTRQSAARTNTVRLATI
jgi:hypothetical protein